MRLFKLILSQLAITCAVSSASYAETTFLNDDTVKQYAPAIYLHSDEKYQPSSLDWFTTSSQINFDGARYNYNQSFDGNYHNPTNATVLYGQKPGASGTTPPYYAIFYPRDNNTIDVVYAMFYPYNQGKKGCEFLQGDYKFNGWKNLSGDTACKLASVANYNKSYGNHVGDWESVTVRFNGNTPIAAYLSAHGDRPKHNWNELEFDGQRPVVYSALGSHALYKNQGYHTSNITDMPTTVDVAMCAAFPKTYSSCKEVCIPTPFGSICEDICSPPIPDVCTNVRMNLHEPTNRGVQWKPTANNIQVIYWNGRVSGANSPLARNYVGKESWLNFTGHYGNAAQGDEQGGESELNSAPTGPLDESLFNKISGGEKDLSFLTPTEKRKWVGLTTEVIAHIITQTLGD